MNNKFGANVSNRILLNAEKFQGYSFNCFWVIKGKQTGGGGGWGGGKYRPAPTQIMVKSTFPETNDFIDSTLKEECEKERITADKVIFLLLNLQKIKKIV